MENLPFDQRACFIAGQAKSGTTLLAALLDGHPEVLVLPQETAYFPTILTKYRNAGRRVQFDYLTKESLYASDRKSTRLNSSHVEISYAVFCLKKKKNKKQTQTHNKHTYQYTPRMNVRSST